MPGPNEITVLQLHRLIGTPECPPIVDVCIDIDHEADPYLIPGSFRHPHTDIAGLIERCAGHAPVIVCQKGRKLSQGLAAWLRSESLDARFLSGGMYGWRDASDTLRVPSARAARAALWVTRHRPKIDRIACPWLIRRFIDPGARFLFVSAAEVMNVADRYGAVPLDVEGVEFSHEGEKCSFDKMLDVFDLHSEPLDRMATVIRGADTDHHELAPQAAGLLAISVGLSRQFSDDQKLLAAGLSLYDALYRWARDGYDESHSWMPAR